MFKIDLTWKWCFIDSKVNIFVYSDFKVLKWICTSSNWTGYLNSNTNLFTSNILDLVSRDLNSGLNNSWLSEDLDRSLLFKETILNSKIWEYASVFVWYSNVNECSSFINVSLAPVEITCVF